MRAVGTIDIIGSEFQVEAKPHVSIKLQRLFGGAQRFRSGVFRLAATPEHAYDLEWFRERYFLELSAACESRYRDLVEKHKKVLEAIETITAEGYVPRQFDLAIPLRDYQRVAVEMALNTRSLLITDQLGLGKSATAIGVFASRGCLPALVVTMTHLVRQWEREINRFAPALRVHRLRTTKPYEFSSIKFEVEARKRRPVDYSTMPDVLISTYSKLDGWVESLQGRLKTVVFDEIQEFRHAGTNKYNAGKAIAGECDVDIGLSGTPIFGYGEEIYNVLEVIAPGKLGTRYEFLREWCGGANNSPEGKASVYDPAALGSYLRESGLMIRRTREEVGRELPDLTIVRHEVECDASALSKVATDVAELAKRIIDRLGTPHERMRDAGELDWRLRQSTGIAKAGAVAEFVRLLVDNGERPVLFGWHHECYKIWQSLFERWGITSALYTGEQSESQKDSARKRFLDGEIQVLIISLRSGAGLDGLQHASRTVVIGELDWSPQVISQCIGRVHRDGQKQKTMAYVLTTDEGSDPVISDVLGLKEIQSHYLLDPSSTGVPEFTGASDDHIRKLAEDVLRRTN